jgi:hypothetical protein
LVHLHFKMKTRLLFSEQPSRWYAVSKFPFANLWPLLNDGWKNKSKVGAVSIQVSFWSLKFVLAQVLFSPLDLPSAPLPPGPAKKKIVVLFCSPPWSLY